MKCLAKYDPNRDVAEVQQHVAVDLADCFKNHVVPSQVNEEELQYGNIENPSQIAGRPSDIFEAMQANRSFSEALESKKQKTG